MPPRLKIKDVAARARDHVEAICAHWLPNGKRQGAEWCIGDRTGAAGESLKVNINTGVWADFATGDKGGDPVALVAYVEGCAMGEASERVRAFLGLDTGAPAPSPAPAPARRTGDDWRPLLPVPADAPAAPAAHPKHGRPSERYEYRDASGALLGYVCRFEAGDGRPRKAFAGLTYGESVQGRGWGWKGFPEPRPLYGLDRLAARPDAPVLLCEGEKAVKAAQTLLPDYVVTTWPNGANSVSKADFSPLRGRHVILWADADDAGLAAMKSVSKALNAAGAASRRWVNLSLLSAVRGLGELPKGFDAADLVAEGWDVARMADFLQQTDSIAGPKKIANTSAPDHRPTDDRYTVTDEGLFYLEPGRDGNEARRVRVSDRIDVLALARDQDSAGWSVVVRFADLDGLQREELLPKRMLLGDGADAVRQLVNSGLHVEPGRSSLDRLKNYLASQKPAARVRRVETLGWHGDAYILPDDVIGDADEHCLYSGARVARGLFTSRGSLASWNEHIGGRAVGNPRLMFSLSMAFAGPLLLLLGAASFAVHWTADSSVGKSTALAAAASVWGDSQRVVHSWRSTDNALEHVAAQHCDGLLILDEIKEVDPRQVGAIAYMLGNGQGKARAHHAGGLREAITWRITMLSSGELGLADHMAAAGQRSHAGQDVRFIELPADAERGHGMWDALGIYPDGRAFTAALQSASRRYYGTAGRAFVAALLKDKASARRLAQQVEDELFRDHVKVDAGSQVQRVAKSFAVAAAAGELAASWGIVPWKAGAAQHAAGLMLCAWMRSRPTLGNAEESRILAHVAGVIQNNWQARFIEWRRATGRDDPEHKLDVEKAPDLSRMAAVQNALGFRRPEYPFDSEAPKYKFFVETERFAEEFATKAGFKPRRVAQVLRDKGILFNANEKESLTLRETLPSGSRRSYCILGWKLAEVIAGVEDEGHADVDAAA